MNRPKHKKVYLLHYHEDTNADPSISKWAGMFGMLPIYIDSHGRRRPSRSIKIFSHIEEAIADPDLRKLTWVWLDSGGDVYLDEFEHPTSNVVYCIGSDYVGFNGVDVSEFPGVRVKLRQEVDLYAVMAAAMLCCDRSSFLSGRRS